jgi:hypothetical protein
MGHHRQRASRRTLFVLAPQSVLAMSISRHKPPMIDSEHSGFDSMFLPTVIPPARLTSCNFARLRSESRSSGYLFHVSSAPDAFTLTEIFPIAQHHWAMKSSTT